jgi:hypothetical protein
MAKGGGFEKQEIDIEEKFAYKELLFPNKKGSD